MTHSSVRHATPVSPTRHRSARHPRRLGFAAGAGALALALLTTAAAACSPETAAQLPSAEDERAAPVDVDPPVAKQDPSGRTPDTGVAETIRVQTPLVGVLDPVAPGLDGVLQAGGDQRRWSRLLLALLGQWTRP